MCYICSCSKYTQSLKRTEDFVLKFGYVFLITVESLEFMVAQF